MDARTDVARKQTRRLLSATTKVQIIGEVKKEMSTEDISENKAIGIVLTRCAVANIATSFSLSYLRPCTLLL